MGPSAPRLPVHNKPMPVVTPGPAKGGGRQVVGSPRAWPGSSHQLSCVASVSGRPQSRYMDPVIGGSHGSVQVPVPRAWGAIPPGSSRHETENRGPDSPAPRSPCEGGHITLAAPLPDCQSIRQGFPCRVRRAVAGTIAVSCLDLSNQFAGKLNVPSRKILAQALHTAGS